MSALRKNGNRPNILNILSAMPAAAATQLAQSTSSSELGFLDGITAGTAAASKALVLDASKFLDWDVSSALTSTVRHLSVDLTLTGAGASVDGAFFSATTEAALGTYANALNGKLDFGTAGRVTGLGGVICAELDLGPGTTQGSYACFEAELNVPASGSLGTRTSFLSLNAWGANVAAFDTSGNLFDLSGVTAGSGKMFNGSGSIGNVDEITHGLRVNIGGASYYILLATAANFAD